MMERESKREKIISDKMREINLKLRTLEQTNLVPDETPSELDRLAKEEYKTKCETAESEFYTLVEKERDRMRIAIFGGKPKRHKLTIKHAFFQPIHHHLKKQKTSRTRKLMKRNKKKSKMYQ